jgi:hypothetical protein
VTETPTNGALPSADANSTDASGRALRTALWLGIAGAACASAVATYFVFRAMSRRRPPDETAERIQSLIDEANRLIRTLEETK